MEGQAGTAEAPVRNKWESTDGVDIEYAKNNTQILSTRSWVDRAGVKHEGAGSQEKQPVSISYSVLPKDDGTKVEMITVNFKKTGARIRGFSSEFVHLLKRVSKDSKVGKIFATEMSFDARTQKFSADEIQKSEEEPEFDETEATA